MTHESESIVKKALSIGLMMIKRFACHLRVKSRSLLFLGEPMKFCGGDLIFFPAGIDCIWNVHKAVRRHYRFDD